jgi:AbiV family abortive infection protein
MDLIDFIAGSRGTAPGRIAGGEQLNRAAEHICRLLADAQILYETGSHATAAFLAIAALEEVAKAHLGLYLAEPAAKERRAKDPLFNHAKKHALAALPTVPMCDRLPAAIGVDRVAQIMTDAHEGRLARAREEALYFELNSGEVTVPIEVVPPNRSRELILFAIEAFDDALVGYTEHSYKLRERTDAIFSALAG